MKTSIDNTLMILICKSCRVRFARLAVITIALLLSSSLLQAQERRVIKTLEEVHSQLLLGKQVNADEGILFKPENESFLFSGVKDWINDTISSVRFQAVSYIGRIGLKTIEPAIKQDAVRLLILSSKSMDEALSNSAIGYLTRFNRRDYTKDACDSVRSVLHRRLPSFDKMVRLAGFLGLTDQMPFLDSVLNSGVSTKIQWSINISLARLGNVNSAQYCLNLAKAYPVDDNIMYNILPDLIYTRQRIVYDYLLEILNSDKPNCTSPNPYYTGNILCGYRVMEELAAVVNGFPLKVNSSREIVTDDYEKALKITRGWFNEHKVDYELKLDVY